MTKKTIWFILNIIVLIYGVYLKAIVATPVLLIVKLFSVENYIIEDIIVPWIAFFLLGYIQWFILIPKFRKIPKRNIE